MRATFTAYADTDTKDFYDLDLAMEWADQAIEEGKRDVSIWSNQTDKCVYSN